MNISKLITDPARRLEMYVESSHGLIQSAFGIDFASDIWQLPAKREAAKKDHYLDFIVFEGAFKDLLKSIVANETAPRGGHGSFGNPYFLYAARYLAPLIDDGKSLIDLSTAHFKKATEKIRKRTELSDRTKYNFGKYLAMLAHLLNRNRLTKCRIEFKNPFSMPEVSGEKHLIPLGAIKAFGEIWMEIMAGKDNDPDRLLACTVALLFCTGFRINELLSLPLDCWHPGLGKDSEGRILKGVYLGYAPEKDGLTDETFPKWIPSDLVPLAQECVDEIRRITEPFRKNARDLAVGRVNLPGLDDSRTYTSMEASELLGFSGRKGTARFLRKEGFHPKSNLYVITAQEIREIVRSKSFLGRVVTEPWLQELHESLFVVCAGYFWPGQGLNGTAQRLKRNQVYNFVANNEGWTSSSKSCFQRFCKINPETGKPWSFTTHDPRHTLTTWMFKHGISEVEIAAYFGRNIRDPAEANKNYVHMKQWEIMRIVNASLERGEFRGPWADILASIKEPIRRSEIQKTMVGNVSYSKLGICSHPEGTTPPTTPEACARCPGVIIVKGNPGHIEETRKQLAVAERKIEEINDQIAAGTFGKGKWLEIEMERRAGLVEMLEIHMDVLIPNGTMIQRPPKTAERKCV